MTLEDQTNEIMAEEAYNLKKIRDEMEDTHGEPVFEDEWMVVFADTDGHELSEIAAYTEGVDRNNVSEWMHKVARKVYDRTDSGGDAWGYADPVVIFKQSSIENKYAL
jgi:hypothetical protein